MNKTHTDFLLIVVRKRIPISLPGLEADPPSFENRTKVLVTNHKEIPEWVVDCYNVNTEADCHFSAEIVCPLFNGKLSYS